MPAVNTSPCDGCNGHCCDRYVVPVTGYDAWQIAARLRLSLEQFLVFVPEETRTAAGFLLDRTETTYSLALNKQRSRRKNKPCIFLLPLLADYMRCAVYDYRPFVCQTFPTIVHHGSVAVRDDAVCRKGVWNVAAMDLPAWRLCLLRGEMESAIYHLVVSRWNACVESGPADASYSIYRYFAYLMNAYSRLERLRRSIPEEEMAVVVRKWGQQTMEHGHLPAAGSSAEGEQLPWQRFLERVEEELAGFAAMLAGEAT